MVEENYKDELMIKEITNRLLIGLDIGGSLTKICIIIKKEEIEINDYLNSNKDFKCMEIFNNQL